MKFYTTIVSLLFLGVFGMAAYGQQGGDILSGYRPGNQFYRDDFNKTEDGIDQTNSTYSYSIKDGLLTIFTHYTYYESFNLPQQVTNYQMEAECKFGTKVFYHMTDNDVDKDQTMTMVFDAGRNGGELAGTYVSLCVMSNYSEHLQRNMFDYCYLSIGREDGAVFTELSKYKLDLEEDNDYHKVKVASVGDSYYYYYDNKFICKLLKTDANPDHYAASPKYVYFATNGGMDLVVNYFAAMALEEIQTKDVTPPTISLLTPVDVGNGIAEDDKGKILVSGRGTDTSGVAWIKLNGQDIGYIQANGYFSFNASSLSSNIIIQACDKAGNIGSKNFSFNIIRDSLVHIPLIPAEQPPVFHAIIIACSQYTDPGKNLPETVTEANRLRSALLTNYDFSDDHIHMLIDKTYDEIVSTLRNVMAIMQVNDNLVITFSGHGTYNQDKTNPVGYWITGAGMDYDHGYISSDQVKSMLSETDCKAKHILILSDACYSGAFKDADSVHMSYSDRTAYNYASTKVVTSCGFEKSPATSVFMADVIKALNDNATIYKKKYLSDIGMYSQIATAIVAGSGDEPNIFNFGEHGNQGGNFYFILKP
jgi:hypothetical protein